MRTESHFCFVFNLSTHDMEPCRGTARANYLIVVGVGVSLKQFL